MLAAVPSSRRDRIAIAGSIAVHLCVLAVVATVPRPSFPVDDPDERTLLSSIVHVERHRPPPPLKERPRAPVVASPERPLDVPVIHTAVTREHAARRLVVAAEPRAPAAVVVTPRERHVRPDAVIATPPPVEARQTTAPVAVAPTAAPAASPAPVPVAAQREDGIGNFGETYPASIDPSARGAVLGPASGVVVRVSVDENGRATAVEFLRGPSDPSQRDELRARLLAAHFIPAACNGLRCAGTVELRS